MDKTSLSLGFISGLNFGGKDYRVGLWQLAWSIFQKKAVKAIFLVGGLVDFRHLLSEYQKLIRETKAEGSDVELARVKFLDKLADQLGELIPSLPGVKIRLVTSPAYDGWIGDEVALRLTEKRRDIYHDVGRHRYELLAMKQTLGVYAPIKGAWMRGDFFSTPVARVLKDEKWRSSHGLSGLNVVGCFASSFFDPGDSTLQRPYLSLPSLSRLGEVRTSDNQVGISIVEIPSSGNLRGAMVTNFNFKDLLGEEGRLVQAPRGSSAIQNDIVKAISGKRRLTLALLEDATKHSRDKLKDPLAELVKKDPSKDWPAITYYEPNHSYGFNLGWFQRSARYPEPAPEELVDDAMMAFGCLHAGCKWTDMKWFRDEFPNLILQHNVRHLFGVGDFIEGTYHFLRERGEILLGRMDYASYTNQEKLAAYLVASVMLGVFEHRFAAFLAANNNQTLAPEKLAAGVAESIPTHPFIKGNHCGWVEPLGFKALATYEPELQRRVVRGVNRILAKHNLRAIGAEEVEGIVASKIIRAGAGEDYVLPSGLAVHLHHPEMGRTKTASIRAQEVLDYCDTPVALSANFHTHFWVVVHDPAKGGQRLCLQVGTMKVRSGFEHGKLKIVDTGIGYLSVARRKSDCRIWSTKSAFFGTKKKDLKQLAADNAAVMADFEKDYK